MQKSLLVRCVTSCLLVVGFFACAKHDLPLSTERRVARYTVAAARAFYESHRAESRAGEVDDGPFSPRGYWLDWAGAETSSNLRQESVNVPTETECTYYQYRYITPDTVVLYPLDVCMVVVREIHSLEEGFYLRYDVPDSACRASGNRYRGWLNSCPDSTFSGVSIYTTMSGYPVSIGRFDAGDVSPSASLFDLGTTPEHFMERLNAMLDTLQLCWMPAQQTRSRGDDDILNGGDIVPVECIGKKLEIDTPPPPVEESKPDPCTTVNTENPTYGDGGGGSGGGGTASGSDNDKDEDYEEKTDSLEADSVKHFKYNDKIKFTDERVAELLDSLFEDCMGKTLLMELGDVTIFTGQNANNSNGSIINLREHNKYGYRSYVLMEELIHCYQRQRDTHSVHPFPGIHYEIEAKVGWVLYLQRIGKELTEAQAQFGHSYKGVPMLADFVMCGGDMSNPFYQEFYTESIYYLRLLKNGTAYPESLYPPTNSTENWGFTNVSILSIDCQ